MQVRILLSMAEGISRSVYASLSLDKCWGNSKNKASKKRSLSRMFIPISYILIWVSLFKQRQDMLMVCTLDNSAKSGGSFYRSYWCEPVLQAHHLSMAWPYLTGGTHAN